MKAHGITALLILLFGSIESAWGAPACECPEVDPLAKGGECGVRPAGIRQISTFNQKECKIPDSKIYQLHALASRANQKTAESLNSTLTPKPKWELLDYISCYRPDTERFCHYKTTLSKYIEYSAKVAHLSFQVQSCLFLKENSFTTRSSSEGALGYVQVMPNTLKDLNQVLEAPVKKYEALLKEKNLKLGTLKRREDIKFMKAEIVKIRARLQARKVWDAYWAGTEDAPKSISASMAKCYRTAFLLGAMKQVYDLHLLSDDVKTFEKDAKNRIKVNGMNPAETGIFLAGAYNQGVAGIANRCAGKKLRDCIRSYPKNYETRQQMLGVRNCVQSGSLAQTNEVNSPKARRSCEKKRCSI